MSLLGVALRDDITGRGGRGDRDRERERERERERDLLQSNNMEQYRNTS